MSSSWITGLSEASGSRRSFTRIIMRYQDGECLEFRIRPLVEFGKLFEMYYQESGRKEGEVHFLYEGIRLRKDDTVELLNMANGAQIDVFQLATGGAPSTP